MDSLLTRTRRGLTRLTKSNYLIIARIELSGGQLADHRDFYRKNCNSKDDAVQLRFPRERHDVMVDFACRFACGESLSVNEPCECFV